MPRNTILVAAQQFMTKELISYEDELFNMLFHDIESFSAAHASKIIEQERRFSIYGTRGVGKTTAMQGILWQTLSLSRDTKVLPISVTVKGAKSASNIRELEDAFYRSIILGVWSTSQLKEKHNKLKETAQKYAPWITRKILEASSIIFPPLILASDVCEKGLKWLINKLNKPNIESIITSKDLDIRHVSEMLISELIEDKCIPIFAIDELDKMSSDTLLSDFFDGNQSWFQGKRGIITLTYTFGESMKEATTSSVRRLSKVETYPGVTKYEDAEKILHTRAFIGVSQIQKHEKIATETVKKILPQETIRSILNVSAPNTYLMLERTYEAIQNAIESKSETVKPEHVFTEEKEIEAPTELENQILKELSKGRLTPKDIADRIDRPLPSIVRSLKDMMNKNWVIRVGVGKRAYYSLTNRGDTAIRRRSNN
jgi:DNA-binding MarR family transcriptional regulator